MVQIYQRNWQRRIINAFICYLRDVIVNLLPVKKLPSFIIKLLYGVEPSFSFFVHPRSYQDVFISAPFLKPIKFFLRKKVAYKFVALIGPFVVSTLKTPSGINGLVVAQLMVPEILLTNRKDSLIRLKRMMKFIRKISRRGSVVGLGAWFPMFTKRGLALSESAKELNLVVTNGHLGTLISIYLTIHKIASLSNFKLSNLDIAIIGVGKMGGNVARVLNGKVRSLTLIDIQKSTLDKTKDILEKMPNSSQIKFFLSQGDGRGVREALKGTQIGVCATSTFRNLLKLKDMPLGYIAIDDSRPEALPRDPRGERIILEGGLLRIRGATQEYDYGFGKDENVFGCLGEAFLLASDKKRIIHPTLGEVNIENFYNALKLFEKIEITVGDFKSSDTVISDQDIRNALIRQEQKFVDMEI